MKDVGKTWSIGGIPLVVEKDSEDYIKPRIAEIGPLDAVYNYVHFGGTEALKRDITATLFSGYKHYNGGIGFYDMVGSGYRALISDQGAEGNYIITEARTEVLQDIHRSPPARVYRINMKMIKESLTTAPQWPSNLLVATYNGVWRTSNFTGPSGAMPTWTNVSGNLPVAYGDPGGSEQIIQLAVDHTDSNTWYVYLEYAAGDYRIFETTNGGTSYTQILEDNDTIVDYTGYDIHGMGTDRVTGELYATCFENTSYQNFLGKWNGSSWSWDELGSQIADQCWGVHVTNGYAWITINTGNNQFHTIRGTYGGSYEITTGSIGQSQIPRAGAFLHPYSDVWFAYHYLTTGTKQSLHKIETWDTKEQVYLNDDSTTWNYFLYTGQMWGSQNNNNLRIMVYGTEAAAPGSITAKLRYSDDNLDSYTEYEIMEAGESYGIINATRLAWFVSDETDDYIIVGFNGYSGTAHDDTDGYETGQHIGVIDAGVSNTLVTGKSGDDISGSTTTGIPYDAGVLAQDGIQVLGIME